MTVLEGVAQAALGGLGLIWLAGWGSAVARVRGNSYRITPDDPAADPAERVSIIIPARDEAHNIEAAVRCALGQDHPSIQVVVLDDGSTDGTAEILAALDDPRLVVVSGGGGELPDGWLGKPWACERAGRVATGPWRLFVDADVRLTKQAVSRAVAYALREQAALVSGFGEMVVGTWGERVIQPAIGGMILAANPLGRINDPERPEALANGQFLLFAPGVWEDLGGHGAVRGEVVDDVAFARRVKQGGRTLRLVHMQRLFSCRMYRSGREAWHGWRKNLFVGIGRSWGALLAVTLGSVLAVLGPYTIGALALLGGIAPIWGWLALPAVLGQQGLRAYLDGVFRQPRMLGQLLHLPGNALVLVLFWDSAIATWRGRALWKGRVV